MRFNSFLAAAAALLPSVMAQYGEITNFGLNPTNTKMYTYVPPIIQGKTANRPMLVELHYCTGSADAMHYGSYGGVTFKQLADEFGFVILYPESPDPGGCWDTHTSETLLNAGGGDSLGVASQIQHAINLYNLDASKVFAVGLSSGASMAITLAGAYPNLIAGAAAYAGVPFGCWRGLNIWNNACADGLISKTGAEWREEIRRAFLPWTGGYPKVQIWHGENDELFDPMMIDEHIKQWTAVHNYPTSPISTTQNFPAGTWWMRRTYGPRFQVFTSAASHTFGIQTEATLDYFGILSPPNNPNPTPTDPAPNPNPGNPGKIYDQCGGLNWTGSTTCEAGLICRYESQFYSQCQPA